MDLGPVGRKSRRAGRVLPISANYPPDLSRGVWLGDPEIVSEPGRFVRSRDG